MTEVLQSPPPLSQTVFPEAFAHRTPVSSTLPRPAPSWAEVVIHLKDVVYPATLWGISQSTAAVSVASVAGTLGINGATLVGRWRGGVEAILGRCRGTLVLYTLALGLSTGTCIQPRQGGARHEGEEPCESGR
jgi:hypothetical protein